MAQIAVPTLWQAKPVVTLVVTTVTSSPVKVLIWIGGFNFFIQKQQNQKNCLKINDDTILASVSL